MKEQDNRFGIVFGVGLAILVVMSSLYLGIGTRAVPFESVWQSVVAYNSQDINQLIIHSVRLPRLGIAILCGLHFAVAGALMQGITNNPMASPSILGVNAGASFGLAIAMILFPAMNLSGTILFSFMGAGLATAIILYLANSGPGKNSKVYLALAGSAISALFMAVTHALVVYFDVAQDLSYWTAGGIGGIKMHQVLLLMPWTVLGLVIALYVSPSITLLSLGDEVTVGLGGKIEQTRMWAGITVLILSGSAVAIAGPVGFIGLIVPHVVRYLVGYSYEKVIPCVAVYGALLVVLADLVARTVAPPYEVPLGAVTALIGVPFFLYLANRRRDT